MAGTVQFVCDRCGEAIPAGEAPASALIRWPDGIVIRNADLCASCAEIIVRVVGGAPMASELDDAILRRGR